MIKLIIFIAISLSVAHGGSNGKFYVCDEDILASDNKCIFVFNGEQPEDWIQEPIKHDIDRDVGADFYRGVQTYDGETMLSVSPAPWTNGDFLVGTDDPVTGDLWSYSLLFELIAPLRDMMMYEPTALTPDVWAKYTRALTDCNSKTEDYVEGERSGKPWSTDQLYEFVMDPAGADIHHYVLQYLEEGAIDLVCLSTDLEMTHCDSIRETAGATVGVDRCNCWFDAYKALYGVCPTIDMTFTACSGTTVSVDCSDDVPVEPVEPVDDGDSDEATTAAVPVTDEATTAAAPVTGGGGGGGGAGGSKGAKERRF